MPVVGKEDDTIESICGDSSGWLQILRKGHNELYIRLFRGNLWHFGHFDWPVAFQALIFGLEHGSAKLQANTCPRWIEHRFELRPCRRPAVVPLKQ